MNTENLKEKLERLKNMPKIWVYTALAAVCFVMLILMKLPGSGEANLQQPEEPEEDHQEDYCEKLEKNLEEIISEIAGAGDVRVMITVEGSVENIYAEDISDSGERSDRETVIVGSKEALLKQIKNPEVKGVLVVCGGGDRAQIKEQVVNAVSTVLDIPASKVCVTKSK